MIVHKKRRHKLTRRRTTIWLPALLTLMIVPSAATGTGSSSVKKAVTAHEFQQVVRPDKPINCETFQAHLDNAIIEWMKLKGTHLILIARLGTGEQDHDLSRARLDYVENYLKRKNVQFVLAEGSYVEGFGRIEVYVGGRLTMSIPVAKNAKQLCTGDTGE